jgi:Ca2+-binding RTX toxin-like protein
MMWLAQASTAGNDVITGYNTADTITGGAGDDQLNGSSADDTYIYSRGDGNDTITETRYGGYADQLILQGIDPAEVSLVRNGNDVTLVIAETAPGAGDGGSILLKGQMSYTDRGTGIDQFEFGDGTVWTAATLASHIISGTTGDDALAGTSYGDHISAGAGNDSIDGGAGHDVIDGGSGADVLAGGAGSDVLVGGLDSDTFVFASGDGNDRIEDFATGAASDDVIDVSAFGYAVIDDVLNVATQNGDDVLLQLDEETSVRLSNVQVSQLHADDFLFAA